MYSKDKICFFQIDRDRIEQVKNIIGKEKYDLFYASDIEKVEKIHLTENLNLIISEYNNDVLTNFSEKTDCSILILDEKSSDIYNHTTLEKAEYFYYLVKTLCRLSWVSRINKKRIQEYGDNYKESYLHIIDLLDELDTHSKGHSNNVSIYASKIGKYLNLTKTELRKLHLSALLHDIGKTIIPKDILTSPNRLSADEFEIIKLHTKMLDNIIEGEFKDLNPIIKHHHEKYDGSGYPNGLKGEEIPLLSRILTVLDSYDAMTSKRIYNNPVDKNRAIEILKKDSGTHFDPEIVEIFINVLKEN